MATIKSNLGPRVTMQVDPLKKSKSYKTVLVDLLKVDADLAQSNAQQYVGRNGKNQLEGRYDRTMAFYCSEQKLWQSELAIDANTGRVLVADGRHRLAVLRDLGFQRVPVTVQAEAAQAIQARYGA